MFRAAFALTLHELLERTRDRWVVAVSLLFAALASALSLYGRSAEAEALALTGPSLVTLCGLLVPLVALVLSHEAIVGERERNTLGLLLSLPISRLEVVIAKYLGRGVALGLAVCIGLGGAILVQGPQAGRALAVLLGPTLLLGLSFLAIGMVLSAAVERQMSAASLVVVVWFLMVFFYDLGLLGLLVLSDGAIATETITNLVVANPAGLYRLQLMDALAGRQALESLGLTVVLPGRATIAMIWSAWIVLPVLLSGLLLNRRRSVR